MTTDTRTQTSVPFAMGGLHRLDLILPRSHSGSTTTKETNAREHPWPLVLSYPGGVRRAETGSRADTDIISDVAHDRGLLALSDPSHLHERARSG